MVFKAWQKGWGCLEKHRVNRTMREGRPSLIIARAGNLEKGSQSVVSLNLRAPVNDEMQAAQVL